MKDAYKKSAYKAIFYLSCCVVRMAERSKALDSRIQPFQRLLEN